MTIQGQDLIVAVAALTALVWLAQRWLRRRRAKAGCDTCAAAMHARVEASRKTARTR